MVSGELEIGAAEAGSKAGRCTMTITLEINGNEVEVLDGASVLDAANASGAYVSQLCKDPDMKPIGACRTCLCRSRAPGASQHPALCPQSMGCRSGPNRPRSAVFAAVSWS